MITEIATMAGSLPVMPVVPTACGNRDSGAMGTLKSPPGTRPPSPLQIDPDSDGDIESSVTPNEMALRSLSRGRRVHGPLGAAAGGVGSMWPPPGLARSG